MSQRLGLIGVACGFLFASVPLAKEYPVITQSRRAKLQGIEAVSVYVDRLRGEEEHAKRFRTEIELRLRQAGIRVEDGTDATLVLGRAYKRFQGCPLICVIQAEVQETGFFARLGGVRQFPVVTWESSLNRREQIVEEANWSSARKELVAAVDEFLNDYLAVNPREPE